MSRFYQHVIPPCRLPIEVSFTASLPQDFSFNLECRVKHKPTPLRLNVKAQGHKVKMGLSFTNTSGDTVDIPLHSPANCEINFGKVYTLRPHCFSVLIRYRSRYQFVKEHWAR